MRNEQKNRLAELKKRADAIKIDPGKRHVPNEHDIALCAENTALMCYPQYQTIKKEVQAP